MQSNDCYSISKEKSLFGCALSFTQPSMGIVTGYGYSQRAILFNRVDDIMNQIERIKELKKISSADPIIYRYQERLYRLTRGGYLYIIQLGETNVYKIGISVDPKNRLKQLQAKSPIHLRIIYENFGHDYESIEKYFHWVFREKRVKGEWFELNQDDILRIFTSCPINECYEVSRN